MKLINILIVTLASALLICIVMLALCRLKDGSDQSNKSINAEIKKHKYISLNEAYKSFGEPLNTAFIPVYDLEDDKPVSNLQSYAKTTLVYADFELQFDSNDKLISINYR